MFLKSQGLLNWTCLDQLKENDKEIEESCKLLSVSGMGYCYQGGIFHLWSFCMYRMYSHFQAGISREPEIQLNGAHQAQFHIKRKWKQHKIKKDRTTSNLKLCRIWSHHKLWFEILLLNISSYKYFDQNSLL